MSTLLERGALSLAENERLRRERIAENIERGKRDVRRGFVFRFYSDTMIDTHLLGAYHKLGPDSPDPDIHPVGRPGSLGHGYTACPWEFEWEGLRWRAEYHYNSGWRLEFYVYGRQRVYGLTRRERARRRLRRLAGGGEWQQVHSPAQVVEALA